MYRTRGCSPGVRRSGQVVVIAAFALVVFCMLAVLAIDVGYMYCTEAELQNASDAGSYAAALELFDRRNEGENETLSRYHGGAEALAIVQANHGGARCTAEWGVFSGGAFETRDAATQATAVRLQVFRDATSPGGNLDLFFAPIFGRDTVSVSSTAVVRMTSGIIGLRGGSGLRPFAVLESDVAGWTAGDDVTITIPGGGGGCGVKCAVCGKKCGTGGPGCGAICACGLRCGGGGWIVPGNWAWLDLDGGASGVPELRNWIVNGYDGDITLDTTGGDGRLCTWILGSTGQKTTLQDSFEAILGQVICLCVYDQSTGVGANGQFRIVGFLAMVLNAIDFHGSDNMIEGEFLIISNVPYGVTGDGGSIPSNLYAIQLVE